MAIFSAIKNEKSNIAINAVAGSGKTTTIVEACKLLNLPEREIKFLAFNKAIAKELSDKLAGVAEVSTSHSFGYSVLRKVYNNPRMRKYVKLDERKWSRYIKTNLLQLSSLITPDTPANRITGFVANCCKLLDLARYNLVQSGEVAKLNAIVDEHNINLLFDEVNVVNILLAEAYKMPANLLIDYTDMIVLPLAHKDKIPEYKFVFVDECQDLNAAQRELMLCAARSGRFIAVGDRNQAINGFAGADCESFDKIAALPNTIELPLSVNYRCGSNMIRLAQEIVPQIAAHDGAIEGEISRVNKLTKELFRANDMVLCRTSAPIVGLAMNLIASGITAVVKGKDIAKALTQLVDNANTESIESVLDYLDGEKTKLLKVIMKERKCDEQTARETMRYTNLADRCQCIKNICQYSIRDTTELKGYIDRLFDEENVRNAVVCSTVHKSKGLEADRVIIALPHKLPLVWRDQKSWQFEQELNLKYVALTRAKNELVFLDVEERDLLGGMGDE